MGDEIINVCGKRLRGLSIDEAIQTLKQPSRDLDIVISRDIIYDAPNDKTNAKTEANQNLHTNEVLQAPEKQPQGHPQNGTMNANDRNKLVICEQRLRDTHRKIAQQYNHDQDTLSILPSDNEKSVIGGGGRPSQYHRMINNRPAYVSRTYIGGCSTSSLALKIHRKNTNNFGFNNLSSLNGSLSSLHETSLNSDAEEVRSSCSAYYPIRQRPHSRSSLQAATQNNNAYSSDLDEVRSTKSYAGGTSISNGGSRAPPLSIPYYYGGAVSGGNMGRCQHPISWKSCKYFEQSEEKREKHRQSAFISQQRFSTPATATKSIYLAHYTI